MTPADPKGFSLIELLVVIAVVAILVAVAIPQFAAYRAKSVDPQMQSDLKNAALAMESYYAVNHAYTSALASLVASGFSPSSGVILTITLTSTSSYTLTAGTPGGTQASFTLDSITGLIN